MGALSFVNSSSCLAPFGLELFLCLIFLRFSIGYLVLRSPLKETGLVPWLLIYLVQRLAQILLLRLFFRLIRLISIAINLNHLIDLIHILEKVN